MAFENTKLSSFINTQRPIFKAYVTNESQLSQASRLAAVLTDGDGRDDKRVPVEERGGLGGEVPAEVLEEQVFLRLLLVAAFRGHGVYGSAAGGSAAQRWAQVH